MPAFTAYTLLGGAAAAWLIVKARRPPAVRDAALCGTGLLTLLAAGFGPDSFLDGPDQRRFLAAPLAAAAAFVAAKLRRDGRPRAAWWAAGAAAALLAAAVLPAGRNEHLDWVWADVTLLPGGLFALFAAAFADRPDAGAVR